MDLTKKRLKDICRKDKLYQTAHLNDKLYLHYKGFRKIQNLEEYTGLKVLWLEGNGLSKIEGLGTQANMKTLYLQENLIDKIEGLEGMPELHTLNLSKNHILKIENISHLKSLNTLLMGTNNLKTLESVEHLRECPSISCLDIQANRIEEPEVIDLLQTMPNLAVLYLQGNPVVKKVRFYRKTMIAKIPKLRFLDDRPVFDDERLRAEAFYAVYQGDPANVKAAQAAEKAEVKRQREEKQRKEEANFRAFEDLLANAQKEHKEKLAREAAEAALEGDGEVKSEEAGAGMGSGADDAEEGPTKNPYSGEEVIPTIEKEDVKAIRETMAEEVVSSHEARMAAAKARAAEKASEHEAAAEAHDASGTPLGTFGRLLESATSEVAAEAVPISTPKTVAAEAAPAEAAPVEAAPVEATAVAAAEAPVEAPAVEAAAVDEAAGEDETDVFEMD